MPDNSYFPEQYQYFITVPYGTDVSEFLKSSWEVAAYQRVADEANIDYKMERTADGQVFAFTSASDMARVQEDMQASPEFEANLSHTESFQPDDYPHYFEAWQQVVGEVMRNNGQDVSMTADPSKREVNLTFETEEAKSFFEQTDFIDLAISRRNVLEHNAKLAEAKTDMSLAKLLG